MKKVSAQSTYQLWFNEALIFGLVLTALTYAFGSQLPINSQPIAYLLVSYSVYLFIGSLLMIMGLLIAMILTVSNPRLNAIPKLPLRYLYAMSLWMISGVGLFVWNLIFQFKFTADSVNYGYLVLFVLFYAIGYFIYLAHVILLGVNED